MRLLVLITFLRLALFGNSVQIVLSEYRNGNIKKTAWFIGIIKFVKLELLNQKEIIKC